MSQTVRVPKFYVCGLQYAKAAGLFNKYFETGQGQFIGDSFIGVTPASGKTFIVDEDATDSDIGLGTEWVSFPDTSKMDFVGILGHNLATGRAMEAIGSDTIEPKLLVGNAPGENYQQASITNEIVNATHSGNAFTPEYDGFTLAEVALGSSTMNEGRVQFVIFNATGTEGFEHKIGSLMLGKSYEMPHSPDLNLTMTIDHGGYNITETKAGHTLTNANWTSQPLWYGGLGAWELGQPGQDYTLQNKLRRSGRRIFDLNFSFIQKTDIFPDVMQNQWFGANDTSNAPYSNNNLPEEDILLDSDTFYSKVFVPTFGMKLPFIMQIDKDNNSPDNFVIVRAVQNSITLRQTAPNLYQVKLKLRETW